MLWSEQSPVVLGFSAVVFLLSSGHVLEGVLMSGVRQELVVSDCFLGTGQEGEVCIAQCNLLLKKQHPGQHLALNLYEVGTAGLLVLGSLHGERSKMVRLTLLFSGQFSFQLRRGSSKLILPAPHPSP